MKDGGSLSKFKNRPRHTPHLIRSIFQPPDRSHGCQKTLCIIKISVNTTHLLWAVFVLVWDYLCHNSIRQETVESVKVWKWNDLMAHSSNLTHIKVKITKWNKNKSKNVSLLCMFSRISREGCGRLHLGVSSFYFHGFLTSHSMCLFTRKNAC